jgi:uncharacterized protein YbgA (DUF1722 family)/uncharacterized protein YbbK (DUF523 family)
MKVFNKPLILLSSCIEHDDCRYDGTMTKCDLVKKLGPYVDFITVCPEVSIGLSIPRQALRIVFSKDKGKSLVFSKTGENMTQKMMEFSNDFAEKISHKKIHGAILKSRSPSCGFKDVKMYKDFGKAPCIPKKTTGIFAETIKNKFNQIAIEDEGRLTNYNIREHFLTRIFTAADFEEVKEKKNIKELIGFQSRNKYLLMSYSPGNLKKLGRITANNGNRKIEEMLDEYEQYLNKALSIVPSTMRNINMLLHLFGYFSKNISKDEKAFFLDNLESYRNKKVPFSVPLAIIHAWVIRFNNEYLMNQTIFEAFPKELIEVTDSGKGV